MKKIIYTAIAIGSLAVLNTNQEKIQAEQVTTASNQKSSFVTQNLAKEDINPKITSVKDSHADILYCYLDKPIPKSYATALYFGNSTLLGNSIQNGDGETIGYSISYSSLAKMSFTGSEIAKKLTILTINTTTSEVSYFPVDYQELKDIISNISQIYTVNPLHSGDTTISGTATPNTKISILTYTNLFEEKLIAQGQSDEKGNFNFSVSEPIPGYSGFIVKSVGKHNENDVETIISQPKDINENLFLNPTFTDQAKSWITIGAQQNITPSTDTQVNFKAIENTYVHLGAVQYKCTPSNKKMKLSMDVKINSTLDFENTPYVTIGNVTPGGLMGASIKHFYFSKTDLNKWVHLEYDLSTENIILPVGFTTRFIKDMDVKNLKLTPLS